MKVSRKLSHIAMNRIVLIGLLIMLLGSNVAFACDPGPGKIEAYPSTWFSNANGGSTNFYYHVEVSNSNIQIVVMHGSDAVKTFSPGVKGPGLYSVSWNGKDNSGNKVAEGSYTAVLKIGVNGSTPVQTHSCAVGIDNTAPTTTYSFSKSPAADGTYPTGVKLSFSATDKAGGSGLSCIYYMYSHAAREGCAVDEFRQYSSPIELGEPGVYTVTFKAADNAGNLEKVNGAYRTLTFTVAGTSTATTAPAPKPTACPTETPTVAPTSEPTSAPETAPLGEVLMTQTVNYDAVPTEVPPPTPAPADGGIAGTLTSSTTIVVVGAASMIGLLGAALFFWKN